MNEDQNNPSGSTPPPAPVAADVPFPAAPPVSFVPPAAPISSVPPAPPFQPEPLAQSAPASQPGKGLAIAGIVLAFCMLQLIGLILSIVAKHKALKPSSANTLATIGIILNAVFGFFIVGGIILSIVIVATAGVQAKAKDAEAKASAQSVVTLVSDYTVAQRALPTSSSELQLAAGTKLVDLSTQPASPSDVEYAICNSGTIARFGYWSYSTGGVVYTYASLTGGPADGSSSDTCEAVTS